MSFDYDEPLPPWALAKSNGEYVLGANLPTKDGRRMGNAHIIAIGKSPHNGETLYHCMTDAGSEFAHSLEELKSCFHPTMWVSEVSEILRKFSQESPYGQEEEA